MLYILTYVMSKNYYIILFPAKKAAVGNILFLNTGS